MSIEGFFGPTRGSTPAPQIEAFVHFPRLNTASWVRFLIDNGSDSTCLHHRETRLLDIDYRRLPSNSLVSATGIGGTLPYYNEPAWLMFTESNGIPAFCQLDIKICEMTTDPAMQNLPSLSGRDFLNRGSVYLDSSLNVVRLDPRDISGGLIMP